MPKTIVPVQQDPFYQWLIHNTALSPSSILKYARAVRTISKEMNDRSVIFKPLGNMSSFEIDIAIASIMENTYFIDKNSRGNHMYSNALKQYRLYLNSVDEHPDCRQYEDAIKNDTSIPETQRTAIVQSRIGQGAFRKQLIEKYQGIVLSPESIIPNCLLQATSSHGQSAAIRNAYRWIMVCYSVLHMIGFLIPV
ncbi:MAG: hypothetical protein IJO56_03910 [Oscillospiraceae bacterium]|nr:hypothetical protein [Oscillospiraceae bacterium]